MRNTAIVADRRYERHPAPGANPERPDRITAILEAIGEYERDQLFTLEPRLATADELLLVHDRRHVEAVEATAHVEHHVFESDTQSSSETYETARLAAGGLLVLLDAVMAGEADNALALVRPPGHHAEADRAMGFCFFNNVAIAARYLQERHGLERILIMDWDVHHGNGTQRSFYGENDVLFISTHQYPFYPGTGAVGEIGVAGGMGFTVNVPFPHGFGDDEYMDAFHRVVEPVARRFDPQFVLISAGFDCHHLDPLGGMEVTRAGIASMTRSLLSVATDHAKGRCVGVLEGGYSLEALQESVRCVLDELGGENLAVAWPDSSGAGTVISEVRRIHERFWSF